MHVHALESCEQSKIATSGPGISITAFLSCLLCPNFATGSGFDALFKRERCWLFDTLLVYWTTSWLNGFHNHFIWDTDSLSQAATDATGNFWHGQQRGNCETSLKAVSCSLSPRGTGEAALPSRCVTKSWADRFEQLCQSFFTGQGGNNPLRSWNLPCRTCWHLRVPNGVILGPPNYHPQVTGCHPRFCQCVLHFFRVQLFVLGKHQERHSNIIHRPY